MIKEAKIFQNGQSQAVRLPKECRFDGTSVFINKVGNCVVLTPKNDPWRGMREACARFTDDFMSGEEGKAEEGRDQLEYEERDWLE